MGGTLINDMFYMRHQASSFSGQAVFSVHVSILNNGLKYMNHPVSVI